MLDHLEAGWDVFEHLALVLPDPAEYATATARAAAEGLMEDSLTRQMGWERTTDRLTRLA
jgi:hypothetical protein